MQWWELPVIKFGNSLDWIRNNRNSSPEEGQIEKKSCKLWKNFFSHFDCQVALQRTGQSAPLLPSQAPAHSSVASTIQNNSPVFKISRWIVVTNTLKVSHAQPPGINELFGRQFYTNIFDDNIYFITFFTSEKILSNNLRKWNKKMLSNQANTVK